MQNPPTTAEHQDQLLVASTPEDRQTDFTACGTSCAATTPYAGTGIDDGDNRETGRRQYRSGDTSVLGQASNADGAVQPAVETNGGQIMQATEPNEAVAGVAAADGGSKQTGNVQDVERTSPVKSGSTSPLALGSATECSGKRSLTRKGRWTLKYKVKCRFCGGKICLRCSENCALRCRDAAIKGLHSHWITDSIIAMQRPSSRLIKAYHIMEQFKRVGITAVFNLTEAGEHPYCGDGLEESSGFSYLPETFMREGISCLNFGWEDMTTPPISLLTDIVRVAISYIRRREKIAVHCHAGYGRTGLVIASIIVMMKNLTADQAVALVRDRRSGSIQTTAQVATVREFANFARGVRVVYHFTDHARVTLGQHLSQQAFLLHGQESVDLRWLPKSVFFTTKMLMALARKNPRQVVQALAGTSGSYSDGEDGTERLPAWGMSQEQRVKSLQYASNGNDWSVWEVMLEACEGQREESIDPRIPAQLLYDWLAQLSVPPITIDELRTVLPELPSFAHEIQNPAKEPPLVCEACSTSRSKFEGSDPADLPGVSFLLLNLLPVGQVRLLQCLTECLREIKNSRGENVTMPEDEEFEKASLRMAVSLLQLNKLHHGILVGRDVAPDIHQVMREGIAVSSRPSHCRETGTSSERGSLQCEGISAQGNGNNFSAGSRGAGTGTEAGAEVVANDLKFCAKAMDALVDGWSAPLRCRPYTRLEGIANQPQVHQGNDEYWKSKRQSVVPPKDLIEGQMNREETMSNMPLSGYTISYKGFGSYSSQNGSWDDTTTPGSARGHSAQNAGMRRRSVSSGNISELVHLPHAEAEGPLGDMAED